MPTPKGRILCTEDDPDTRELIILVLKNAGFEAECVANALAALEMIKAQKFDLYLIDSWLRVSGIELCKTIREFDSKTPILFYTGAAYEADKAQGFAAGAQGYLVKPAGVETLISEVRRLIAEAAFHDRVSKVNDEGAFSVI